MAKRSTKSDTGEAPVKPATTRTRSKSARLAAPADPATMPAASEPTEDEIRFHAYLRYVERGRDEGGAFDDWLHAERLLKKGS